MLHLLLLLGVLAADPAELSRPPKWELPREVWEWKQQAIRSPDQQSAVDLLDQMNADDAKLTDPILKLTKEQKEPLRVRIFAAQKRIDAIVVMARQPDTDQKQPATALAKPKIKLIYDGDIGPDPCDFTTLSMLHEYHKHGLIELLGVAGEAPDPYLASTFSIYNQVYKNDVPIGAYDPKTWGSIFSDDVVKRYQNTARGGCHAEQNKTIFEKFGNAATLTAEKVMEPVALYRKLLAAAEDNSVIIYAAGQLFNFPVLLASPADKISPLTGKQLVQAKVKEVIFMGGCFPDSKGNPFKGTDGAEWNWWAFGNRNTTKTTLETLAALGKPLAYIGWEQGVKVPVGKELTKKLGRKHPTTESYYLMRHVKPEATELPADNPAFDDLGLFYAVEGGVGKYFNKVPGRVQVDEKGGNTWVADKDGKQAYITIIPGKEAELCKILSDRITGDY